jgi:hypothetical protein
MHKWLFIILYLSIINVCASQTKNREEVNILKKELSKINDDDQKIRLTIQNNLTELNKDSVKQAFLFRNLQMSDSINQYKIDLIIKKYDWPDSKKVDENGSKTIWQVIQHSDLNMQERYLNKIRNAVKLKLIEPKYLAYLEDRINTRKGLPQTYGTQFIQFFNDGRIIVLPIEDVANVNKRRSKLGLSTLENYIKDNLMISWDFKQYNKDLNEAKKYLISDKD